MRNQPLRVTLVGLVGLVASSGIARAQVPPDGAGEEATEETPEQATEQAAVATPEQPSEPRELAAAAAAAAPRPCAERAHDRTADSVVRVRSGDREGVGVLAVDSSHVVTALWIVRDEHRST